MARRAPSRCTKCARLATRHGRCDDHQRQAWENPSANSQALTGSERRRLRAALINAGHTCAWCGTEDNLELDHIIEIADGGAPRDLENCQLLCEPHHEKKSRASDAARRQRKRRN
jgi:5-methylcytosine-specific restriction protein A